jgi:broad specificity phosphatase PhoE
LAAISVSMDEHQIMNLIRASLEIHLIRHGETAWSLTGQHTSRTDLPLTEKGAQEARELRERLRGQDFDRVFTSPRLRARQTCELSGWAGRSQTEPDLAEWEYGDYEGRRSVDIREERPDWDIFTDGCPGGESPAQITERADRLIARLRTYTGRIALFSHGHFGRVFGARWIGLPLDQARHFSLGTASVSVLGQSDRPSDAPVIIQWNLLPAQVAPVA